MSYLGNEPLNVQYIDKKEYTATAGQTIFNCTYEDRVDVYINGILLASSDFTADTGADIVLVTGATAGDIVQIDGWMNNVNYFNGISRSDEFTATGGQTTFDISYDVGYAQVFLNGLRLDEADYTATDGTSIVLSAPATAGDVVFVEAFGTFASADHYTKSASDDRYLQPTGDGSQLTGIEGVPSGIISMWSGAAAAIPSGWNLCDGTNGTPNLVGKFIKASGTAGGTGGSNTHSHSHTLAAGAHTLSVAEMPSHQHTAPFYAGGENSGERIAIGHPNDYRSTGNAVDAAGGSTAHAHSLSGSIANGSNEPEYFELCYIMKS